MHIACGCIRAKLWLEKQGIRQASFFEIFAAPTPISLMSRRWQQANEHNGKHQKQAERSFNEAAWSMEVSHCVVATSVNEYFVIFRWI